MFSGKGLPKERDVTAILSWPVWQLDGVFNQELFGSISSMFNGKGLPREGDVVACIEWLSQVDGIDREAPAFKLFLLFKRRCKSGCL